jgi:putative intracellular protease/amidase
VSFELKWLLILNPDSIQHPLKIITRYLLALTIVIFAVTVEASDSKQTADRDSAKIASYHPRVGHSRPIIAVVGLNRGTEVTDYVIPYGVLSESGVADVVALGTEQGPIQMMPALKIEPQATIATFDARFAEGADYVVVPAVHNADDPALLGWIRAQASKGATIVGICDGVWALANAGLLTGHRATGHWYSLKDLERKFPATTWIRNSRYVADGSIVTTTGVTASIPVSLALVEAIAGSARAMIVARKLGVADWSPEHDSNDFRLDTATYLTAARNQLSFWSHEDVGIPVSPGVDEIALALVADAWSRSYRSQAFAVSDSQQPIRTKRGLVLIPDDVAGTSKPLGRSLVPFGSEPPAKALDGALTQIADSYGRRTAAFVALQMEYPQLDRPGGRAPQVMEVLRPRDQIPAASN